MLFISLIGVGKVYASPLEWTQNPTFVTSGYRWDTILYDWEFVDIPFFDIFHTQEVFFHDTLNYVSWPANGVVELHASDPNWYDPYGRSARVTYGPFIYPYSDVPPQNLSLSDTGALTLKGVISNYGSANNLLYYWTGIKFDAWFRNPASGRRLVIEMYFHGTGVQGAWGNEYHRTIPLGRGDIDDLLIKLQAFPQYCTITGDIPSSNFASLGSYSWGHTGFVIDLKGIWQKAANYFGRSSTDYLYAVALDVETGRAVTDGDRPYAFAQANEIRVTYTTPPNTPTLSGPSSGYRWTDYTFTASTIDRDGDSLQYQFDWGDGSTTWTNYYAASHSWNDIGAYSIRVRAKDSEGLYSGWSPYKTMNIINEPGNPCPTLFAWNGSQYNEIGILNIHANSDITFIQGITQTLAPENGLYKLSLRELDGFTSHIDFVKLYAVDNDANRHEGYLVWAVHNELGHVERLLLFDDGRRVDMTPQQTIDLRFVIPNTHDIAYFIFEIDGYNRKA